MFHRRHALTLWSIRAGVGGNLVSNTMTTMTRTRFLRHQGTHLASGGGGGISIDTGAFHISDSLFDTNYGMPEENGGGLLLVGVAGAGRTFLPPSIAE